MCLDLYSSRFTAQLYHTVLKTALVFSRGNGLCVPLGQLYTVKVTWFHHYNTNRTNSTVNMQIKNDIFDYAKMLPKKGLWR